MLTKVSKTEEDNIIKEARLLYQECAPGGHVAKMFERFMFSLYDYFYACFVEPFEPYLRRMGSEAARSC